VVGKFVANVRAGFGFLLRHPSVQVGVVALVVSSLLVGEAGVRLLAALACLGLMFAALGAYMGVDLEADAHEHRRET
jgi:hypothetical protein